jgi:hypothetical protein
LRPGGGHLYRGAWRIALSRRVLELLPSESLSLGLESLAWGDLPRGVLHRAWSLHPFPRIRCLVSCGDSGADDGLSRLVFPKASCLPEHGNDARLLHRDLLFARAALRQWRRRDPRMTIPRNGGIRKAERAVRRRHNDRFSCFQSENEGIFCGASTKITNS